MRARSFPRASSPARTLLSLLPPTADLQRPCRASQTTLRKPPSRPRSATSGTPRSQQPRPTSSPANGSALRPTTTWCSCPGSASTLFEPLQSPVRADPVPPRSSQRFPFSSRRLLASSSAWQTLLPCSTTGQQPRDGPVSTLAQEADVVAPAEHDLPEVLLDESGETLSYLLHFLEPAPAQARPLSFPRDWELMCALDRYSVRLLHDAVTSREGRADALALAGLARHRPDAGCVLVRLDLPLILRAMSSCEPNEGELITPLRRRAGSNTFRPPSLRRPSSSRRSSRSSISSATSPMRRASAARQIRRRARSSRKG